MLIQTLKRIRDIPFSSFTQLANELDIDKTMVSHIIDKLKVMGYLREDTTNISCNGECKKCVGCPGMNSILPVKILIITEKGNQVLK